MGRSSELVSHIVRQLTLAHLGPGEIKDQVHGCYVIIDHAITSGAIRQPERPVAFIVI